MKLGIIGAGNMASALAGGMLTAGAVKPAELSISDMSEEKRERWQSAGAYATADNTEVAARSEVVIFAVKPNVLPGVLEEVKPFAEGRLFISIAAGFELKRIEAVLGNAAKIVRVMPNTPAQVNCGMAVLSPNDNVTVGELKTAEELFKAVGDAVVLDEKYINVATALHGSSPAYVYMMIDAMADGGVKHGLPKQTALRLAAKAVEGSAKMVLETGKHPASLKDDVCSPGGTTIAAVCELEKHGFYTALTAAIDACVEKAENM